MSSPTDLQALGIIDDVEAALARTGVPGCSVAVLEGDEIVFDRASGQAVSSPVSLSPGPHACRRAR
jgi:hypothetical protein